MGEELTRAESEIAPAGNKEMSIVSDEALLGVYGEIMDNLRQDRGQVSELVDTFSNMVLNDGDSSTASKEALVNLLKTKIETSDRMSKIADLMTRIKLKQPDTYQPWMGKGKDKGGNTINIYDSSGVNRKSLMERIQKEKEGK
jgi:anthranilate phosphoribosyltransferase